MAKYSNDELKEKAKYTVAAQGTAKYNNLIMSLSIKTGKLPVAVEQYIRNIANS